MGLVLIRPNGWGSRLTRGYLLSKWLLHVLIVKRMVWVVFILCCIIISIEVDVLDRIGVPAELLRASHGQEVPNEHCGLRARGFLSLSTSSALTGRASVVCLEPGLRETCFFPFGAKIPSIRWLRCPITFVAFECHRLCSSLSTGHAPRSSLSAGVHCLARNKKLTADID